MAAPAGSDGQPDPGGTVAKVAPAVMVGADGPPRPARAEAAEAAGMAARAATGETAPWAAMVVLGAAAVSRQVERWRAPALSR